MIPQEEFLSLTATSYSGEVWTGRTRDPRTGGILGGPGMASGIVYELQSTKEVKPTEMDHVKLYLRGRLAFPPLHMTKRRESRAGKVLSMRISRDYAKFKVGNETFLLSHKGDHTEIDCIFECGGIKKNRHLRLVEALTFALCQFIWPSAMVLVSGGKRVEILRAPNLPPSAGSEGHPPLFFDGFSFGGKMSIAEVYKIARSYYKKILDWEAEKEHPVSSGVCSIV